MDLSREGAGMVAVRESVDCCSGIVVERLLVDSVLVELFRWRRGL